MAARKHPSEQVQHRDAENEPSHGDGEEHASRSTHAGWAGLIEVVKHPLQLVALVVLVVEGILIALTRDATGNVQMVLVVTTAAVLPLVVLGAIAIEIRKESVSRANERNALDRQASDERHRRESAERALTDARTEFSDRIHAALHEQQQTLEAECKKRIAEREAATVAQFKQETFSHDVFISTPMAALNDDKEVKRHRANIEKVRHALRDYCRIAPERVFYAGTEMYDKDAFEKSDMALRKNWKELKQSKVFLMIAPDERSSSIYVEAGMAVALGKPCVFFAREKDHLPWLVREATAASKHDGLPSLKVYEYTTVDQIIQWFQQEGEKLFD